MLDSPNSLRRFVQSEWTIAGVTIIYIAPALVVSLRRGNGEFVMYVAVLVILLMAVFALHRKVHLHPAALWGLSFWGLAHMAGGLLHIPTSWTVSPGESHVLYNWWLIPGWLKFDQLVHAYGFGLTTWICWQSLARAFQNRGCNVIPTFGLLVLCAAGGIGFGALNEVVEFLATRLVPETNVGGYENTGWDLVANLIGATLAAAIIWGFGRGRARLVHDREERGNVE